MRVQLTKPIISAGIAVCSLLLASSYSSNSYEGGFTTIQDGRQELIIIQIKLNDINSDNADFEILREGESYIKFQGVRVDYGEKLFISYHEMSIDDISCMNFDPEYGIFFLKQIRSTSMGVYVEINNLECFIPIKYCRYWSAMSAEAYVMEGYPVLSISDTLRNSPVDSSHPAVMDYFEYSYKPVQIEGDWLYVTDDKDCPLKDSGDSVISGWVKWRDDNGLIIRIVHSC